MSEKSNIEWTESTIQPSTGCSHAGSPGCDHCYAARLAATRLKHHPHYKGLAGILYHEPRWTGDVRLNRKELEKPLRWKRPHRIFICSMGDLFHDLVPFSFIADVFQVIADCPDHTFMILTKRPLRMKQFFDNWWRPDILDKYIRGGKWQERPRLFLRQPGCSECSHFFLRCLHGTKEWGDKPTTPHYRKVEHLSYFGCPDSVCDAFQWSPASRCHGVGVEMNNGEISVREDLLAGRFPSPLKNLWLGVTAENQQEADKRIPVLLQIPAVIHWVSHEPALNQILYPSELLTLGNRAWVVAGGESGPGARPSHPDYFRKDRDQCVEAGVPFFFKQWGQWCPDDFHSVTRTGLTPKQCWVHISGEAYDYARPYVCEGMIWRSKKAAGRLLDGRQWNQYPEIADE